MDELVNTLSQKSGLPQDKARGAGDTVVNYLKSRLPASAAGQVHSALTGEGSSISEHLAGILGKKSA
jgi:hypothetical protein